MFTLRNPVAHESLSMFQYDAMLQLMFSSMITYEIDKGVTHSGMIEFE